MKKILFALIISAFIFMGCEEDPKPQGSGAAKISTGEVLNISSSSATITGELTDVKRDIETYGHVWSTNSQPTIDLATKTEFYNVSSETTFTSNIAGLEKGTNYYVRAYYTVSGKTSYGNEVSFETKSEFFKFQVKNYIQDGQQAWVMIYTNAGQLLDIKQIYNNNTTSFDWPEQANETSYMVQLFYTRYNSSSDYYDYLLYAYTDVSPDTWILGSDNTTSGYEPIGQNKVYYSGIDFDTYLSYIFKNRYSGGWESNEGELTFDQYFNPDDIYIKMGNEPEAPYFYYNNNVGLNESLNLTMSDFTQMSNYVDYTFPGFTGYAYIESSDDYSTPFEEWYEIYFEYYTEKNTCRAYYPGNTFTGYDTYLWSRTDYTSEYMYTFGTSVPTNFERINAELTVINPSISSFQINISENSDLIRSYFTYNWNDGSYDHNFRYYVYGAIDSDFSYQAPVLPYQISDISSQGLDVANLNYSSIMLEEYNNYHTYSDMIYDMFVEPKALQTPPEIQLLKYFYNSSKQGMDNEGEYEDKLIKRKLRN